VRRILDAYRLSPTGGGLALALGAAILVLILGPKHDEAPALIVIVVVVAIFAVQGGGSQARFKRSLDEHGGGPDTSRRRLGEPDPHVEKAGLDEVSTHERDTAE